MLLAVTSHITLDLAPVPLLWVLPLALYLISFIVVFARWSVTLQRGLTRGLPALLLCLVLVLVLRATEPVSLVVLLNLLAYFAVCLVCHGTLALERPSQAGLTSFYLTLSLGGVLGGLACALVAPLAFSRLGLIEYPLLVLLAALVRPDLFRHRWAPGDLVFPVLLGLATAFLVLWLPGLLGPPPEAYDRFAGVDRLMRGGLMFGVPTVVAYTFVGQPLRFALALAALLLAGTLHTSQYGRILSTQRNFFGVLQVTQSEDGRYYRLIHGTTMHGQQRADERERPTPLMYYHPRTPVGRVLQAMPDERMRRVGVVGLGCGALAAYARPGQSWTFFEIDPGVARIAQDTRYFTYLKCCQADAWDISLGDARRRLEEAPPEDKFDVLVLDAFSSDAIPVHLLTREALALYTSRLSRRGVLVFHVSNRYLDLVPLLGRLAHEHDPPLVARWEHDIPTERDTLEGKVASTWVVLAREAGDLEGVARYPHFHPIWAMSKVVWTDRYTNILGVWRDPSQDD